MSQIHISVLGPARLVVERTEVPLTPLATRLLALLVAAEGTAVPVSRLHRELWPDSVDRTHRAKQSRTDVQKRITELRQAMDPERSGEPAGGTALRTEQLIAGRESESAYRLVLESDHLDCAEFAALVNQALYAAPSAGVAALARALELWRGPPLAEAGAADFARALARRLTGLYETACAELMQAYITLGQLDEARPLAEQAAARRPGDPAAAERLRAVREGLRARRGDKLLERDLPGLRARLTVVCGDLFEQRDANIVAGFSDTFDTSTIDNLLISRESVQGQLLHRFYGGNSKALDRELQRGLRPIAPQARERAQDKPKGKRLRYPIGTVVPLPLDGRWIFAVAYARQGNDLAARSSPEELRLSLERLWAAVGVRGQLKPVAIPVVGSGLARVRELSREQLTGMIIETFVRTRWNQAAVSPELRIVIKPDELAKIRMPEIARYVQSLDQDGRQPRG